MTLHLDSTTLFLVVLSIAAVYKIWRARKDHEDLMSLRKDMRLISETIKVWACNVEKPPPELQAKLLEVFKKEGVNPEC